MSSTSPPFRPTIPFIRATVFDSPPKFAAWVDPDDPEIPDTIELGEN